MANTLQSAADLVSKPEELIEFRRDRHAHWAHEFPELCPEALNDIELKLLLGEVDRAFAADKTWEAASAHNDHFAKIHSQLCREAGKDPLKNDIHGPKEEGRITYGFHERLDKFTQKSKKNPSAATNWSHPAGHSSSSGNQQHHQNQNQ